MTIALNPNCVSVHATGGYVSETTSDSLNGVGAVAEVDRLLPSGKYGYVACSDPKSYDTSINHTKLLELLRQYCSELKLLDLVRQYCERTVIKDGCYADVKKGIPAGSVLSPLMAALYLSPLNQAMEWQAGVKYVRFMDDRVIPAENCWKLGAAMKRMNEVLNELKLEQHPEITFIGRLDQAGRTFDFLGFDFTQHGLIDLSVRSCSRITKKTAQIYDQTERDRRTQSATIAKVEQYRNRWLGWLGISFPAFYSLLSTEEKHRKYTQTIFERGSLSKQ